MKTYSPELGHADRDRLAIINKYYNPGSQELLLGAGLGAGLRVLEVGCGHGGMTEYLASVVSPSGHVVALDSSREQLDLAKANLEERSNVDWICSDFDEANLEVEPFDLVYARCLLLHLRDPVTAIERMIKLLKRDGRLVLETCDVRGLRFIPSVPDIEIWQHFWFALGDSIGASYRFCDRALSVLTGLPLRVTTFRINQPVSSEQDAKMLHILGFRQLIPVYLENGVATRSDIDRQLVALDRFATSPNGYVELYRMNQFIAEKI